MKQIDLEEKKAALSLVLKEITADKLYDLILEQIIREMLLDEIVNHLHWSKPEIQHRYQQLISMYHPSELERLAKTGEQRR
jgi:hypothetical protein